MDCKHACALLHPYLDGELSRPEVDAIEAHLPRCADCTRQLASMEALRRVVRETAPRHAAPAALRLRLERLEPQSDVPGAARRSGPQGWALAASLLAAFLLGVGAMNWFAGRADRDVQRLALAHDLLSSHLRALAAASAVDVVSTDRHTVKPWFAGKIAESPPVIDLAGDGFPLVGGRIDYVGGRRVGVLVYGHGQHLIDVYLLPATARDVDAGPILESGYRVTAVRVQDQPAWIVADVDEQELARFRQALTR